MKRLKHIREITQRILGDSIRINQGRIICGDRETITLTVYLVKKGNSKQIKELKNIGYETTSFKDAPYRSENFYSGFSMKIRAEIQIPKEDCDNSAVQEVRKR